MYEFSLLGDASILPQAMLEGNLCVPEVVYSEPVEFSSRPRRSVGAPLGRSVSLTRSER